MIDKATPLGEVKGYYRSTLISALNLLSSEIEKTRKSEEKIGGETAHLDDKDEFITELKACLGAATAESMANTPIGKAIEEGEHKHQKQDAEQIDLAKQAQPEVNPFDPPEGVDIMNDDILKQMLELAGFNPDLVQGFGSSMPDWTKEQRLDVYRFTKALTMVGVAPAEGEKEVTRDVVPQLPAVIVPQTLSDEQRAKMSERELVRLENVRLLADALEAKAINWPAIITEMGIKPNRDEWNPTLETVMSFVDAGPYQLVTEDDGYRIGQPSTELPGAFTGEATRYDRVGALARIALLNAQQQVATEPPPEAPAEPNDIEKAKARRGGKKIGGPRGGSGGKKRGGKK